MISSSSSSSSSALCFFPSVSSNSKKALAKLLVCFGVSIVCEQNGCVLGARVSKRGCDIDRCKVGGWIELELSLGFSSPAK